MSPGQYEVLMEMLADYISQGEAEMRMAHYDPAESVSHEELVKSLGITSNDLADINVDIKTQAGRLFFITKMCIRDRLLSPQRLALFPSCMLTMKLEQYSLSKNLLL